jgi:hypothetical protein
LDPLADARAARLNARVCAQTASIAKVKRTLMSNTSKSVVSDESFRPKPSKVTRRVENVAAFLAAVADKKMLNKARPRPRRWSRLSAVSDEGEDEAKRRSGLGPNGRPLVSRREARAPSPSPPASGDEGGDASEETPRSAREARRGYGASRKETAGYATHAVPSSPELEDFVARVRALRAGRHATDALHSDAFGETVTETETETETETGDALVGSLEAHHGTLRVTFAT